MIKDNKFEISYGLGLTLISEPALSYEKRRSVKTSCWGIIKFMSFT